MNLARGLRWCVWAVVALLLSGCGKELLLRDLTERDANEIVGVLYTSSVEAQKVADAKGKTFAVEVLSSDVARAVAVLRALGLPKSPRPNLNEVFRSTGFAPHPLRSGCATSSAWRRSWSAPSRSWRGCCRRECTW